MPITTTADKNALLDKLSVCYNRTSVLLLTCQQQGLNDEAARVQIRKDRLDLETENLISNLLNDWIGVATTLGGTIDTSNQRLTQAVADIQGDINTAQNIVQALGYIDQVVGIAAKLLA